jgi:hypothetical protein
MVHVKLDSSHYCHIFASATEYQSPPDEARKELYLFCLLEVAGRTSTADIVIVASGPNTASCLILEACGHQHDDVLHPRLSTAHLPS